MLDLTQRAGEIPHRFKPYLEKAVEDLHLCMEYAVTARERQGLLEFAKTRSVEDVEDLCARLFAEKKPPESIKYFRSAINHM